MELVALGIVIALAWCWLGMGVLRYEEQLNNSNVDNYRPVIIVLWPIFLAFEAFD